jgi:hypothetical protein
MKREKRKETSGLPLPRRIKRKNARSGKQSTTSFSKTK